MRPVGMRRRIVATFVAYGLFVCALFGGFSFLFAFVVEDAFFTRMLEEEVAHQQAALLASGAPAPPLRHFISVHLQPDTLPAALRAYLAAEPTATEAAGSDGLHYHILRFVPPGSSRTAYVVGEVSRDLVVRPLAGEILTILSILSLGLAATATILGAWLGQRAMAPISRLAAQVDAAGHDGIPRNLTDGIPPGEEAFVLARALDDAMARIAALVEREKTFTRDASHELRTPLAVIKSNAELLACQAQASTVERAALDRIARACQEMERTLELLLTLARDGSHRAPSAPIRLASLIERVVVDVPAPIMDQMIEVEIDIPESCIVHAPIPVVDIILSNLIGNAMRHGAGGMVSIAWRAPWLDITNKGPGLPAPISGQLFEPGVKGADSTGHGLGLSIVKRLCDRHGLDLDIADAPGGGVSARVRLG